MNIRKAPRALFRYLTSQDYRFLINASLGKYDKLDDVAYLSRRFRASMHQKLDLSNPVTFNEKLQWLKLYDRRPEYTMMVDKYLVRDYIANKLGEEYLIPLLGVWDDPDEIDFDSLPDRFVLKCNHNSGLGMCICKDKSALNIKKVKADLRKGLKQDYYLTGREWPYKNVPRKIIAEKYMEDNTFHELRDYKFFCFNGVADCVMVCLGRSTGNTKFYFYDKEWKLCRYNILGKSIIGNGDVEKPDNISDMFAIAEKLSQGIPFSRIDLYNVNQKIYFGEITFFPDSGFDSNLLPETDIYFGSKIHLKEV